MFEKSLAFLKHTFGSIALQISCYIDELTGFLRIDWLKFFWLLWRVLKILCFPDFLIAQKQQYFLSTPHINMVIYFESNCDRVISENIY